MSKLKEVVEAKGETVTKSEICKWIAEHFDIPLTVVKKVINLHHEFIIEEVAKNNVVQLKGFATFSARYSPEYPARNPQTGESITVSERVLPSIRFGEPFKRTVDGEFKGKVKPNERS